jgi:hypothetical protein
MGSTLKAPQSVVNEVKQCLSTLLRDSVGLIGEEFLARMCEFTPIEDGHAHTAYIAAYKKLKDRLGSSVVLARPLKYEAQASNDPKAAESTIVRVIEVSSLIIQADIVIGLPFLEKLNYGKTIRADVWGNRGTKLYKYKRPGERGPLYGPRNSIGKSKSRKGMLFFEVAGGYKFKEFRTPPAYGFFEAAIAMTKSRIQKGK